ncbi:hypothetical protein [Streptomyces halstedii]|nr:hypothetical protein [Streptomyces halstedii]
MLLRRYHGDGPPETPAGRSRSKPKPKTEAKAPPTPATPPETPKE